MMASAGPPRPGSSCDVCWAVALQLRVEAPGVSRSLNALPKGWIEVTMRTAEPAPHLVHSPGLAKRRRIMHVDTGNWDSLTILVAEVFGDVLGMDGIAEDDDFYDDCAGSSFQAWSVILALGDIVGTELEFSAFLLDRTPRGVAARLLDPSPVAV